MAKFRFEDENAVLRDLAEQYVTGKIDFITFLDALRTVVENKVAEITEG